MKKSQRLQTIVDLNANDEKKALQALGIAQGKKQDLEKQLENLHKYQQEYKEKLQSISESGIKIEKLLEFKSFICKLEQAIDTHKKNVLDMDGELTVLRKAWENKHLKTKNLQKICDISKNEENTLENRREQKEQDDRVKRQRREGGTRNA